MTRLLSILLAPFSLLYGIGVSLYQALYSSGFIKPVHFSVPVISIGNLSVGGTGKSPHIEYFIRFLSPFVKIAILSRGYNRSTIGYQLLQANNTSKEVGDEPKQIKSKFPDIPIAVCESRALGVPKILSQYPETKVVLLDDAFQHLQIKPALNILLTEYANPFIQDFLLPSGRLREWRYGANRAHAVIVTKCPEEGGMPDEEYWRSKLQLHVHQKLFFSTIHYGTPYNIFQNADKFYLNPSLQVVLISAVAQSSYLSQYLMEQTAGIIDINFEDHHYFTENELRSIVKRYISIEASNKIILTTEKDATRLWLHKDLLQELNVSVYAIPIEVEFFKTEEFQQYIKSFLLDFKM